MASRFRKVPQPPIDRLNRPQEHRPWWLGALIALAGLVLLLAGLSRQLPTADGKTLRETELVRLVTRAGAHRATATTQTATAATTSQATTKPKIAVVENPPDYCPT